MATTFPDRLDVDGTSLRLHVERRSVRNLNARLRGGRMLVSVPLKASSAWVMENLPHLARTLLRRAAARRVNEDGAALRIARRVAERFPEPPRVESVTFSTTQRTLWGSCSPGSGTIRLSAALRHMPPWVLEAVVAHELCHVFHAGHGSRFRALLRRVCPDVDRADGFLSGAQWHARTGAAIPAEERGPLEAPVEDTPPAAPPPAARPAATPHPAAPPSVPAGTPAAPPPPLPRPAPPRVADPALPAPASTQGVLFR